MRGTKVEVFQPDRVTVDNTAGGQTLEQLGIVLDKHIRQIDVMNVGNVNIYVANGAADANSYLLLPTGSVTLKLTRNAARLAQFYCATTSDLNVLQSGD